MMSAKPEQSLADAVTALESATKAYEEKHRAANAARSEATTALNALNEAQARVAHIMKKLKDSAPYDSDWSQGERRARSGKSPTP